MVETSPESPMGCCLPCVEVGGGGDGIAHGREMVWAGDDVHEHSQNYHCGQLMETMMFLLRSVWSTSGHTSDSDFLSWETTEMPLEYTHACFFIKSQT